MLGGRSKMGRTMYLPIRSASVFIIQFKICPAEARRLAAYPVPYGVTSRKKLLPFSGNVRALLF
jgi:hypothetical protein